MIDESVPTFTYDAIIGVAKDEADKLRPSLPVLPTNEQVEPFLGKMWAVDRPLIDTIEGI